MAVKYDSQRFKHYQERKYKGYKICQLEECEKPVQRFGKGRRNKYCCPKHARKAKNIYKRLWELKNAKRVKGYKTKYLDRKNKGEVLDAATRRKITRKKRRKKRKKQEILTDPELIYQRRLKRFKREKEPSFFKKRRTNFGTAEKSFAE